MSLARFDPRNITQYEYNNHPEMLHFQFAGSEMVIRYKKVKEIEPKDINPETCRTQEEENHFQWRKSLNIK